MVKFPFSHIALLSLSRATGQMGKTLPESDLNYFSLCIMFDLLLSTPTQYTSSNALAQPRAISYSPTISY